MKPPPKELAAGKYPSGIVYYGDQGFYPFGLWEDELIQHIGIFGRSGSGKTNLCYMLLEGLVAADKPFLIFDWKQNYRDLIAKQPFRATFYLFFRALKHKDPSPHDPSAAMTCGDSGWLSQQAAGRDRGQKKAFKRTTTIRTRPTATISSGSEWLGIVAAEASDKNGRKSLHNVADGVFGMDTRL